MRHRRSLTFIFSASLRRCLLMLPAVVLPALLFAQSDTTKQLNQVNIKATPAPQVETIIPAQQITAKDFIRSSSFTVADAIRNFAGVNIKDYGGIGGLKTISVRSLGANHTAVMLDGIQLNDAQSGQVDLGKFNLNNVQEISLYNGQPGELLQPARSFAAASVLVIKPIRPVLTAKKPYEIAAGVRGGSFGLINPTLQWQQRLSNNWSFIANGSYINANGKYKFKVDGDGSDTLATRHNSHVRSIQSDAALYWHQNDSSKFNIRVNYYNSKRGLPGAVAFYTAYSSERLDNEDVFVQSAYEHAWQSGVRLLLSAKASQLKTRYLDPDFLNQQGFLDQHYNQREVYGSAALAYQLMPGWQISYALDASVVKLDADIYNYAYPTRRTFLNVLATNFSKGKWQLQGNLLQTNITDKVQKGTAPVSRSVLTPTFMASFKPFEASNLQLRAFYKKIFRAPTLDEIYFYAVVPRAIKPEFANQYNAGVTYSKNLHNYLAYIVLTTDIYYNNIRDKILAIPSKNPAIFSYSNIGRVDIKGVDFGLKAQTRQQGGWYGTLNANYTYQQAIDVTDPTSSTYLEQIPYTPKHTLALNAGVNYKRAGLYFNHVLSSARYYTGNNVPEYYVPGYAISDASVVYHFTTSKTPLTASLEVNNLSDKNYSVIRSYPMPGRSFRLSIQITN